MNSSDFTDSGRRYTFLSFVERSLMLFLALAASATPAFAAGPCENLQDKVIRGRSFTFFDSTIYAHKPNLEKSGFKNLPIVDRGIWPPNSSKTSAADPALVKVVMQKVPDSDTLVMLDFEDFPLTGSDAVVSDSLVKMAALVTTFKTAAPGRTYGFYATLPLRDYWRAVAGPTSPRYKQWQSENDKVQPLESEVGVLFPSIYTFYNDRDGWVKYAKAQICEARRLSSKPVYAVIWPEYHDSSSLANTPIDADFWKIQLETTRRYADGVVIWGGYDFVKKRQANWDENAPWWQVTQSFVLKNR